MKPKIKIFLITSTVLIAALLLTGTAFAEGEEPPPEPAETAAPDATAPPAAPAEPPAVVEELVVEPTVEEPTLIEEPVIELLIEEPPPVEEPAEVPPAEELPLVEEPAAEPPAEAIPAEELPADPLPAGDPLVDVLPVMAEDLVVEETLLEDLLLVDEAGQAVDLDSQAAGEMLAAADPSFATGDGDRVYRFFGPAGACATAPPSWYCADGLPNPIQATIDYINTWGLTPDYGAIYVEKATYVGSVILDQSQLNLTKITALRGVDTGSGYPTIKGTLTIQNLVTSFRVENFIITGGLVIEDANIATAGQIYVSTVTGPVVIRDSVMTNGHLDVANSTGVLTLTNLDIRNTAGYGISISSHKGSITMTNVKSSNNLAFGATIYNAGAPGNVTITNCAFDHNNGGGGDIGLGILSNGTVTINGLSASYNGEDNLVVGDFANLSLKNAVLMWSDTGHGGNFFTAKVAPVLLENVISRNNGSYGLNIHTAGAVTLRSVDAHNNHSYGICIDTTTGSGAVSLTNIRVGGTIGGPGLYVLSKGTITITSIISNFNDGDGVRLDNTAGTGGITITSPAASGVAGANAFYSNTNGCGVYIRSKGAVTLTNLDVNDNSKNGVDIDNSGGTSGVTINKNLPNWVNGFFNNTYSGILIATKGAVAISDSSAYINEYYGISIEGKGAGYSTLTNVSAYENGLSGGAYQGLRVDNTTGTGGVTIRSTVATNILDFGRNNWGGIDIRCKGAVSISNVNVSDNMNTTGLYIENYSNPTASPAVTISNGFFNRNAWNGVSVYSKGLITMVNVEACENNGEAGVRLDNYTYGGGSGGVTIRSTSSTIFYSYSSNRGFNGYGILILSRGAVSVGNVVTENNKQAGIAINNDNATIDQPVSITNSKSFFNDNGGIIVNSRGAITLTNVSAEANVGYGAYLDNRAGTGLTGVIIRSTTVATYYSFGGNIKDGISIYTDGAVSVGNLDATGNGESGLYILRTNGAGAIAVTRGEFSRNSKNGMTILSTASVVTLTDVTACENDQSASGFYSGLSIDTTYGTVKGGGVTIRSSLATRYYDFSGNSDRGIAIEIFGPVSIANVIAEGNNLGGITINNQNASSDQPVSITNATAGQNDRDGIVVISRGAITLTNVSAFENGAGYYGVYLDNTAGAGASAVTIRSTAAATYYNFNSNGKDGIRILSEGPISVGNVTSCGNGESGLYISRASGTGAISVTRGEFHQNVKNGVFIISTASVVTLMDVTACENDPSAAGFYSGFVIDTTYGTVKGGSVTIRSSVATKYYEFSSNSDQGIAIVTYGLVSISNVSANNNFSTNIDINNYYVDDVAPRPVSLTRTDAHSSHAGDGIHIYTKGSVTLNTIRAYGNSDNGLYIEAYSASCLIPANVTLTGTNNGFSYNSGNGISISTEGNILLAYVRTNDNLGGDGMHLVNNYAGSTGNVTISAIGTFMNSSCRNSNNGIDIQSKGTISISRLAANKNGGRGGYFINNSASPLAKGVTLTACEFSWNDGDNGLFISSKGPVALNSTRVDSNENAGFRVFTEGAVTLNGVSASYNSVHDADIPFESATIYERLTSDSEGDIWRFTAGDVSHTITLSSKDFDAYLKLYHYNASMDEWDLIDENDSYGGGSGIDDAQITISLVSGDQYYILATTAGGWGEAGAYSLDLNGPGTTVNMGAFSGAVVNNSSSIGNVTIISPAAFWSHFSENNSYGLSIDTRGAVSITNASASFNGDDGMYIGGTPTHTTIRNTSTTSMHISGNGGGGINLQNACGNILLSGRIFLNGNGKFGAYLNNSGVPIATPMNVTVANVTANGNKMGDGLHINSIGQVSLSSIIACNNAVSNAGVYVYNASDAMRNLIINGTNLFSENTGGKGLEASSRGVISISGVRAEANDLEGIYIHGSGVGKGVTLSNIISQYNKSTGLAVYAKGIVTFTNVRSNLNQGSGLVVNADNVYHIYFNYCTIIGNKGNGIFAMSDLSKMHLVGTNYFGNNTDNSIGDYDFYHY